MRSHIDTPTPIPRIAAGALLCLLASLPSPASDQPPSDRLSGIEFQGEIVLDSIAVIDGGASRGSAALGMAAVTFGLDTERARLWKGGRVLVQAIGTFGDEPSTMAGDLQVFSNIEAGDSLGILEAWVEQSLGSRISILVGYHDLNREFDVVETAGELLNSSFGIGPEISQIGPSVFPKTHVGARLELRPTIDTYLKVAAYDGLECGDEEAAYYALESGWLRERIGPFGRVKVALGAWSLASRADAPSVAGGYVLAEGTITTSAGRTVGAFVRAGRASNQDHPVERYIGAGIRLGGVVPDRPDDVISLGVARAAIDPSQRLERASRAETTIELTWVAQVTDRIAVQPDIQYIDSPAGTHGIAHTLVGGVRLILTY